jgi:hypothetical protein
MVRGLLVPVVLAPVLAAAAAAAPAPKNVGCGAGRLVLNITYRVENDVDTGVKGNNWAFDSYQRAVRVWRKTPTRFCSSSTYNGSFTSIDGWSPGGRNHLPAGIRGSFKGSSVTAFRGTFAPRGAPLRGFLGVKDFACTSADEKGACAGTYDWLREYFTGISAFRYLRYSFTYHATENGRGTFTDRLVGGKVHVSGDIAPLTGKKP